MNILTALLFYILIFFSASNSFSQRFLFQSDFENINFSNSDSLPLGWKKLDADSNYFGRGKSWAVRDTNQILGGDSIVNRPHSHSGKKSLHISWLSGKGGTYENDDWVWTDSLRIQTDDSLIFWALLGNIPGISYYVDSVQIWVCSLQNPDSRIAHLTTLISSLDTNINIWKEHKFNLTGFSNQRIYIGFRYYIPVENALWCNIDDMIIGNRSASIGINTSEVNIPYKFSLFQNYPNPFNPVTNFEFQIPKSGFVKLTVSDLLGEEVAVIVNTQLNPGSYNFKFDGSSLSSGVYFYSLEVGGDIIDTKRLVLLK